MNNRPKLYYCNHCKIFLENLEDLLFVEEASTKGFCSEDCIEKFYQHLVIYFEEEEKTFREELNITDESCLEYVGKPKLMEMVLSSPSEVWHSTNDIQEEYFCFLRRVTEKGVEPFYLIITCLIFDNKPSFILCVTATRNKELVDFYRRDKKLDNSKNVPAELEAKEGFQTVEIEEELL